MTSAEMLIYFRERYNLSKFANQGKLNSELYLYLNAAVNRFIKTRFTGNNIRQIKFEGDQKRTDDLRTLIKTSTDITKVGNLTHIVNGSTYAIPNDYLFGLNYYVLGEDVAGIENNDIWYSCDIITTEQAEKFIERDKNKPIIDTPKIFFTDSANFTILYDRSRITGGLSTARAQYIKKPTIISNSVNCDLPEHTHEEIVEIAVGLAVESIENTTRLQTQDMKLNTLE
jgi:hypothetical protein